MTVIIGDWLNDGEYRFKRICFGVTYGLLLFKATIRYHLLNSNKNIRIVIFDEYISKTIDAWSMIMNLKK